MLNIHKESIRSNRNELLLVSISKLLNYIVVNDLFNTIHIALSFKERNNTSITEVLPSIFARLRLDRKYHHKAI